jgi:hypothetical protein
MFKNNVVILCVSLTVQVSRPVLYGMIERVPSIQKGQRICDTYRQIIAILPERFRNEAVAFSRTEYVLCMLIL